MNAACEAGSSLFALLVPFQINPHYLNVALPGHHGETRDERLAEFARVNPEVPVIGLPEGDWLRVSGSTIELRGPHPAAWFHGEKPPTRMMPGCPTPFGDPLWSLSSRSLRQMPLGSRAARG